VPTNDPPVAVNDGVATVKNVTIGLPLVKLLVNDSDPDGDALTVLSVSATSTNGGGVLLTSTNVMYTPVSNFSGNDRFSYTIGDGHDNTATAQVEIFVSNGNLPSANVVILTTVPGGYRIRFAGIPGLTYNIQRAPVVTGPWTTLSTVVAPAHGIIEYTDTNAPPAQAFYRTVGVP
jgi:hypothetical protein